MKVVIVGGRGQLGSDLVEVFQEREHDIQVFGREDLPVQELDVVQNRLALAAPDVIVNCSVFHPVDRCEVEAADSFAINALGPWHLAQAAKALGAKLVHFSSDYVFDGETTRPYLESDPTGPRSVFGVTKVAGEQLIQNTWERHFILRTSGLYGLSGSRVKGGNFVETMLRLGKERGRVQVVSDLRMAQTATRTVAVQTEALINTNHFGLYHASDHGDYSWYEFALAIFEEANLKVEVVPVPATTFPAPAPRPRYSVLASEKLGPLGLDRMRPIRESLREYLGRRSAVVPA